MAARSFVGAYILLQLAVAIFSIRYWPLTDYPMFSAVYDKFAQVESYRLQGVTEDGRREWLPRSITGNLGHSDFKLNLLIRARQWDRARAMLVDNLRRSSPEFFRSYRTVVVVRRTIKRTTADFLEEDTPVLEVPLIGVWE